MDSDKLPSHLPAKGLPDRYSLLDRAMHAAFAAWTFVYIVRSKQTRLLTDARLRHALFSRDATTGLLESSILQNPLYVPSENARSLDVKLASAGRYAAFDAKRMREFGRSASPYRAGRIVTFLPPEHMNYFEEAKYPDVHTATRHISIFNFYDFLNMTAPSLETLLSMQLLRQTTYEQAFRKQGTYAQHENALLLLQINDKMVYQVTPRGNSLIHIIPDQGDEKPDEKLEYNPFSRMLPTPAQG